MQRYEKYNIDDASITTPIIIKNNTASERATLRQKQSDDEKIAKYKYKYSVAFNYKFTCPFCLAITNLYHANRHISNKSCIEQRFYREKLLTTQHTLERFKIWLNSKRRRVSEGDFKGDDEDDEKILTPIITGVDKEDEMKTIQNINIRLIDKINTTTTEDELKYLFKTLQIQNYDLNDFLKRDFKQIIIFDNPGDNINDIINISDYDDSKSDDAIDYNDPPITKQAGGASNPKNKHGSKKATISKTGSKRGSKRAVAHKAGSKKAKSPKAGSKKAKSPTTPKTGSKKTGSKRSDNITCECGTVVRFDGLARHKKTTAHLNRVNAK
jgi:hypothetical protein